MKRFSHRYPKWLIGLSTTALLLLTGTLIARTQLFTTENAAEAEAEVLVDPLLVETLNIEPVSSYQVSRIYTGEIAALRSSDLGFQRDGELATVFIKEGDPVSAGQPIAQLDKQNLQAQRQRIVAQKAEAQARLLELERGARQEDITAARAEVRDLENQLKLQQAQRSRREFLYEEGAISREELDEFTFGTEALAARLDRANSQLDELLNGTRPEQVAAQRAVVQQLEASIVNADVDIDKSTLKAPFEGVISAQQVDEGTVVAAGQSVVRLMEKAAPEARIGLPVGTANRLATGDTVNVNLGDQYYPATVTSTLPEVDPNTRTQIVVFQLESSAISDTNPGQTVRVELTETIPTQGFWLPLTALTQDVRGLWSAYTVVADKMNGIYRVQSKALEIIHQESDRALVKGTIQTGDQVVSSGVHRLVPEQQVQPE
ncbi:MAG: HlyD family efflux transporter periplasmic adaptor subunit [Cyanobacteria bacterium P01_H01_bin.15]